MNLIYTAYGLALVSLGMTRETLLTGYTKL